MTSPLIPLVPLNPPVKVRTVVDVVQAFYHDSGNGAMLEIDSTAPVLASAHVRFIVQDGAWLVTLNNPVANNHVVAKIPLGQYGSLAQTIFRSLEQALRGRVIYKASSTNGLAPPNMYAGFDLDDGQACGTRLWFILGLVIVASFLGYVCLTRHHH